MALNTIALKSGTFADAVPRQVASGTTGSITDGMLVLATLGSQFVSASASGVSTFAVDTNFFSGIAKGNSTETASVAGKVDVFMMNPTDVYYIPAQVPASVDTQAEYDLLVGNRVNYQVTGNLVTCLTADAATNPFIIEPMSVASKPGMIAVRVRAAALYNA